MMDDLENLVKLFRQNGGIFDNMTVAYSFERGFYCSGIDSTKRSTVFCPAHLLVDVNDIGVNEQGLFIKRPEKYGKNIMFLESYFSFHFGEKMINGFIEERNTIDLISDSELKALQSINLPYLYDEARDHLEYAKQRIIHSHRITFGLPGKIVLMPFVTFLNHDRAGAPYNICRDGISVSGEFSGEVLAHYDMGDVMTFLRGYGFVAEVAFIYSLPFWTSFPSGITLNIYRDITKTEISSPHHGWPLIEKKDNVVSVSWFPLRHNIDADLPGKVATELSRIMNVKTDDLLHAVFQHNLKALQRVASELCKSENSYIVMVVAAVEKQLAMIK